MYGAMQLVQPPVATTYVGAAVGISALLLAGGRRQYRAVLPHARVMIHQPSAQVEGVAADIDVHAREILRLNSRLVELLARHTGQRSEQVARDINRDFWLSAEEAIDYGLADNIVGQRTSTATAKHASRARPE
jgi:ATP-dependent Clp protease protease subunit